MAFVFVAPAYAERDKHSSLYDKLREVCDLWIMNDVMKLEEFQPERKKQLKIANLGQSDVMTHDEATLLARNQLSFMDQLTGSPPSIKSAWFIPGHYEDSNIPDSETKTRIIISLSGVCRFEADNIIDYMIRHAAKGWDGHVMAKPTEYQEDTSVVWEKINVVRQ